MLSEVYHSRDEYDPDQLKREGRDYWRDTLAGIGDAEDRVKVFMARYASACELQGFSRGGRFKTREAYKALGGRKRNSLNDACGKWGRFVVAVGLEYETSVVDFRDLPELAPFRDVPEAQFDNEITGIGQRAIERLLGVGVPYVLVFERGEQGHNHMHVAHPVGSLSVGRKTLNTTPGDVLKTVRYFLKGPKWSADNLTAFVNVVRLQGRAAKRMRYGRLGSHSVICADVETLLGFSVLKPVRETSGSSVQNVPAVLVFDANRKKRVLPLQPDLRLFHPIVRRAGLSPPAAATYPLNSTHPFSLKRSQLYMQRIQELQGKIVELQLTINKLDFQASATDGVQELLTVERELSANNAVLTRLQELLREAEKAQEAQEAAEQAKTHKKALDELRAEYDSLAELLLTEAKGLHAEFYRVARKQTEIAPRMQGLRYEYQQVSGDYKNCPLVFSYPSDSKFTDLVNLSLTANESTIGLIWAALRAPQATFEERLNAEKRAYSFKPSPVSTAPVDTHESLFSRAKRGVYRSDESS